MRTILSILLFLLLQQAGARVIRLTVWPVVTTVELHNLNRLVKLNNQYSLHNGATSTSVSVCESLLVTEASWMSPGSPNFEFRTWGSIASWINPLKGHRRLTAVANHFTDYFLHHKMWTLCNSLIGNNAAAVSTVKIVTMGAMAQKMFVQNDKGDSLDIAKTKAPLLVALYDIDCPLAVTEYLQLRSHLQEGYKPVLNTAVILLHQDPANFSGIWQGMPPAIYHNTGQGFTVLRALLSKDARLPSYWILAKGHMKFIGLSYRDVRKYFNKTKGA